MSKKTQGPTDLAPADLLVDLAALRRKGLDRTTLDVELPIAWLSHVLSETDAHVKAPGRVSIELFLQTDGVVVATGDLQVGFEVPCGRCLDAAPVDGSSRVCATFLKDPEKVAKDSLEDEDEVGLAEEELDTWAYDGLHIDLAAVVGEQVKLAYPIRSLCARAERCRGLCNQCGAELNAQATVGKCEACGALVLAEAPSAPDAEPEEGENPLADALRKLQLDN